MADPVLVLLDEVDLDPILVDPGPGLVLRLLEVVLAVLVVATGPGVGLNPTRGLGLGRVLTLVELEAVLAK